MKLEKMVSVVFTPEELQNALIGYLECEMNDLLFDDPKHAKLQNLITNLRLNHVEMDWVDGNFHMSVDGVLEVEEL